MRAYADEAADGKLGKVAQPLRIAVSGGTVSPAIFETLAIIGQAAVLRRIDRCMEHGQGARRRGAGGGGNMSDASTEPRQVDFVHQRVADDVAAGARTAGRSSRAFRRSRTASCTSGTRSRSA